MREGENMDLDAAALRRKKRAEYMKVWRKKNPDKVIEARKKFQAKHPDSLKKWKKRWQANNIDKHKAHKAVCRLVRNKGFVKPTTCQMCGCKCDPEGHHEDYSQRRNVIWLCTECHRNKVHRISCGVSD